MQDVDTKELKFIGLGILAAGLGPLFGGTAFSLARGELGKVIRVDDLLFFSLLAYPFAVAFACLFGLPLFFLARHFGLAKWWSAIGSGLLVGCMVQFIVLSGTVHPDNLLSFSAEGAASGLLFFLVWRHGVRA